MKLKLLEQPSFETRSHESCPYAGPGALVMSFGALSLTSRDDDDDESLWIAVLCDAE